jgi:hypothetical protein
MKSAAQLIFGVMLAMAVGGCDTKARSSRTGIPDINAEPNAVGGRSGAGNATGASTTITGNGGNTSGGPGATGAASASGTGSGPPSSATTGSASTR